MQESRFPTETPNKPRTNLDKVRAQNKPVDTVDKKYEKAKHNTTIHRQTCEVKVKLTLIEQERKPERQEPRKF